MRKSAPVIGCLSVGTIATALLATGTIFYLMFTTSAEVANRKGLFGAVFFSVEKTSSGNSQVGVGVDSLPALGLVWLVITASIAVVYLVFRQLVAYRTHLQHVRP